MFKYLIILLIIPAYLWSADTKVQVGNTDVEAFEESFENQMIWVKFTMGATDGYLDSLVGYFYDAVAPDDVKMSIYTDAGDGTPGTPIDSTEAVTLPTSASWVQSPVITGVKLTAGSTYFLCAQSNTDAPKYKYDTGASGDFRTKTISPFIAWPSPADDDGGASVTVSFYAVISENVEILLPNSDVTTSGWDKVLADDYYWEGVDDYMVADAYALKESGSATNSILSLGLPNTVVGGTIDSVRAVTVLKRGGGSTTECKIRFHDGSNTTYGPSWDEGNINLDKTPLSAIVACPDGSWDQASIDNLQIGFDVTLESFTDINPYQLHIRVYFTPTTTAGQVIIIQ